MSLNGNKPPHIPMTAKPKETPVATIGDLDSSVSYEQGDGR